MSPRVLLAVPCMDMVHADFAFSLARLLTSNPPALTLQDLRSSDVVWARNEAARLTVAGGYSHLMFLDSDMEFPADTLHRLLGHGKPLVGATYVKRCEPWGLLGAFPAGTDMSAGLVEALELPTGCLLIHRSVLERIEWPWFRFEYGDEVGQRLGEDLYFCRKARGKGVKVWCDLALTRELGHVGVKKYTVRDGIEHVARMEMERRRG